MKKTRQNSEIEEIVSEVLFYTGLKSASEKFKIPEIDLYKLCRSNRSNQPERFKKLSFYKNVNIRPESPRLKILGGIGIEILDYEIITQHSSLNLDLLYLRKKIIADDLSRSLFHEFLCSLIELYKNDKDGEIDKICDNEESPMHAFETINAGMIFFESTSYLAGAMIHFEKSSFIMSKKCIDNSIKKLYCIDSEINISNRLRSRKSNPGGVSRGKQISLAKLNRLNNFEKNNFDNEILDALSTANIKLLKSGTGPASEFVANKIYDFVSVKYSDPSNEYDLKDKRQLKVFIQNRIEENQKFKKFFMLQFIREKQEEINKKIGWPDAHK